MGDEGGQTVVESHEVGVAFLDDEGAEGESQGYVVEGVGF